MMILRVYGQKATGQKATQKKAKTMQIFMNLGLLSDVISL